MALEILKGSSNLRLTNSYNQESSCHVVGCCDLDFGGDLDKRRLLFGYIFTVGGNTIS